MVISTDNLIEQLAKEGEVTSWGDVGVSAGIGAGIAIGIGVGAAIGSALSRASR